MQKINKKFIDMRHELADNEILAIKNLTCEFADSDKNILKAVDDFSYVFEKNKIHFIIGNSGSGKSTLVAHFNGLIKSKKGYINAGGIEIFPKPKKIRNPKLLRRKVSMVFQFPEYQLFKDTIEKDISFGPKALGIPKFKAKEFNRNVIKDMVLKDSDKYLSKINIPNINKDNIFEKIDFKFRYSYKNKKAVATFFNIENKTKLFKDVFNFEGKTPDMISLEDSTKYLEKMGLDKTFLPRNPFGLSGGQKRRVAIAGILSIEPEILIFDEPTAGLDPQGEQEMMDIILEAKKSGQTVIVITHTMDHVLEVGDNVIVMDKGKIFLSGTPYEVFTNPELTKNTKMEIPKVINVINNLVKKDNRFNVLYEMKPKNTEELANCIESILSKKESSKKGEK